MHKLQDSTSTSQRCSNPLHRTCQLRLESSSLSRGAECEFRKHSFNVRIRSAAREECGAVTFKLQNVHSEEYFHKLDYSLDLRHHLVESYARQSLQCIPESRRRHRPSHSALPAHFFAQASRRLVRNYLRELHDRRWPPARHARSDS